MAHPKSTLLLFFLSLVISSSSGKLIYEPFINQVNSPTSVKGIHDKIKEQFHLLHKDGERNKSRKVLEAETVELDYDYPGPNPKHDPKKGRGGGRSL